MRGGESERGRNTTSLGEVPLTFWIILVVIDPSEMNSLSSDMLTFKNITENELSGSNSLSSDMLTFLPDMSSLSHDSSIGLLEFLGFPKAPFGSILVTFGCLLGALWNPLGTLGVSIGSLWVPFGSLWVPFGPL